jgi:hypothetical protein
MKKKFEGAWEEAYHHRSEAEKRVHFYRNVEDYLRNVREGYRPYKMEYEAVSGHNGDYYMTSDTVWRKETPVDNKDYKYTLLDTLPEYLEAKRLIKKYESKKK